MENQRQAGGTSARVEMPAKPLSYEQFLEQNPGIGTLKIQASRAQQAIPIQGMHIIVMQNFLGTRVLFFEGETDADGMISAIELPAPPQSASLDSTRAGRGAVYQVYATHPQFEPSQYEAEIFEGVTAILPITPRLAEGGK